MTIILTEILTLFHFVSLCSAGYVLTGGRLGDFPPPDESKHVAVTTSRSFYEVQHNCGKVPFHVNVYAYSTAEGDNLGYRFEGTGSCQNDGQETEGYGGILFAYNEKDVRLWVPSPYGSDDSGRVIFIGEGWGGNTHSQSSTLANVNVVVEIWKDGPVPSFEKLVSFNTQSKVRHVLGHPFEMLPEVISVRVTSVNKASGKNYHFHGTGSSQTSAKTLSDKSKKYGGVIFGYNEQEVVLWGPNKKNGGCIAVGKRWGNGRESVSMFSHNCTIHVRLWVTSFPLPVFQSAWTLYHANQHADSFVEIQHNIRKYPSLVKVQYRRPSENQSYYIFEGTASVQSTPLSSQKYGGVIFAYNKEKIRIWLPTASKIGKAYSIFVGEGWGDKEYTSESAEIRVLVYADICRGTDEVVDGQGNCRSATETKITHRMGIWSNCSNPCGEGERSRSVKECNGKGFQPVIRCSFEKDFCGFIQQGFKWIRTKGSKSKQKNPDIPFEGFPPGSFFVYSESYSEITDRYATGRSIGHLISPPIDHGEKCILRFNYNSMSYFGNFNINVQTSDGQWIEKLWRMKDALPMSGLWRKGYLNFGDLVKESIIKFSFVQELDAFDAGCPTQCNPISITNIKLDCEESDSLQLSSAQCEEKEIPLSSCFMNALSPFQKGQAWSKQQVLNIKKEKLGEFVVADGKKGEEIASYKVRVLQAGTYKLWIDSFALNNYTNDVYVKLGDDQKYLSSSTYNRQKAMWLPVPRLYLLSVGVFKLTLYQKEKGFKYKHLMLVPRTIDVWGSLGMQNRLIPDNSFTTPQKQSLSEFVYCRLNSPSAWMPGDEITINRSYLGIKLPDIAMVNKMALQGGHSLYKLLKYPKNHWLKKFKISFSLDGEAFQWYRNDSLIAAHEFVNPEINQNSYSKVIFHDFAYVLVARGIRLFPTSYNDWVAVRLEFYGHFISKGSCPQIVTKAKEGKCNGNGDCGSPTKECVLNKAINTSTCGCKSGHHGDNCQHTGCKFNPCKNGGKCSEVDEKFKCDCGEVEGYTGKHCEMPCTPGTYGRNCTQKCECESFCDSKNGSCVCQTGYMGPKCDKPCPEGFYGDGCHNKCPCSSYFKCNPVTGACFCAAGFRGDKCEKACDKSSYGEDCKSKCSCQNGALCDAVKGTCACKPGWHGNNCNFPCPHGHYGEGCRYSCQLPANTTTVKCDHVTGHLTCVAGFRGYHCEKQCDPGWYGEECKSKCDCSKENTIECDRIKGRCLCKPGYESRDCKSQCGPNYWGMECKNPCLCKNKAQCHHKTGECTCVAGYQGDRCESICKHGSFGNGCAETCSCHIEHTESCVHTSGKCLCKPGYFGTDCEKKCPQDRWGKNCVEKCLCSNNATCDHMTGFCECTAGFQGQYCQEACDYDTYGLNCQKQCQCKNEALCNSVTGSCYCQNGYQGQYCEHRCDPGFYGKNCEHQCQCNTNNSERCDFKRGTCFCLPGYTGEFCTKECHDNFWGKDCNKVCKPCRHANGPCDKRDGNCSCSTGFTGNSCQHDCPFDRFGEACERQCSCGLNEICNNVNGDCYSIANHSVVLSFIVNPSTLSADEYVFRENLEILLTQCYFKFQTDLKQYPDRNITDFLKCKASSTEEKGDFIVRIISIKQAYTSNGGDVSVVTITVQNKAGAILGKILRDLFIYMGKANIDNTVSYEFYPGKKYGKRDSSSWSEDKIKWIIIGLGVFVFLVVIVIVVRCTKKIPQPSPFQKIKRNSKDNVELQSCLAGPQSHLLAFENPYYDVIAAMGLDDDIEEDYLNPLYEMPSDSETEPEDAYLAYHNSRYHHGNQFSFDKDSGFSSGTLM